MKIIVTGGGTGGHIYPALAFATYAQEKYDATVLYVGSERGLEQQIIEPYLEFKSIRIQGLERSLKPSSVMHNAKTMRLLVTSLREAKRILREFKPDVVLGTGGYVALPVLLAAHQLNIETFIHEQNSIPGLTNKITSKFASKIFTCFVKTSANFNLNKVVYSGNPRGTLLYKQRHIRKEKCSAHNRFNILIISGSQGSLQMNRVVHESLEALGELNANFVWVTGKRYFEEYNKEDIPSNITIVPYVEKMEEMLVDTDFVISRSGATSISEYIALNIPALYVPSPNVTANHQFYNAIELVEAGASLLCKEDEFTKEQLICDLQTKVLDLESYKQMQQRMDAFLIKNPSEIMYNVMIKELETKQKKHTIIRK